MLRSWMRRMSSARFIALATIGLLTGSVLMESAEARFGRSRGGISRSFGNRGSRSSGSGAGGQMQPLQRNRQRDQANGTNTRNNTNPQANRGSWLQRNPLLGGLMGALAGTVLGAMLINAFGGMGGMGGFGGIIMLLLLGGMVFAVVRMFRQRQQPALASGVGVGGGFGAGDRGRDYAAPTGREYRSTGAPHSGFGNDDLGDTAVNSQTREQGLAAIALEDSTMTSERLQDTLTNRFFEIQEAWSAGDRTALSTATTTEMYDEYIGDLDEMERRNERNVIKNIVMRSFDITEAWQEGDLEFATAYINARLLDYTERNGQVVEGDATNPTQFSEYWTFVRPRGRGEWKLSAINQEA